MDEDINIGGINLPAWAIALILGAVAFVFLLGNDKSAPAAVSGREPTNYELLVNELNLRLLEMRNYIDYSVARDAGLLTPPGQSSGVEYQTIIWTPTRI